MTSPVVTIAFAAATAIVGVAAVLGIVAVVRAQDDARRAVVADLLFFAAVAVFVLVAVLTGSAVVFDVAREETSAAETSLEIADRGRAQPGGQWEGVRNSDNS